jgi:hypothetical protein
MVKMKSCSSCHRTAIAGKNLETLKADFTQAKWLSGD